MKKSIIKKLIIQIARKFGLEIIEQSNLNFEIKDNKKNKSIVIPLGKVELTRKVSDFLIIFRTNIDILIWDQNKKRIFEEKKIEYAKRSLISIVRSLKFLYSKREDIKFKIMIVDNSNNESGKDIFESILKKSNFNYEILSHNNEEYQNKIKFDKNLETFGNLSSLLKCYETAKINTKDLIYFVEDDYLHEKECLIEMIETFERISSQLKRDIFVCPSDYPYLYSEINNTNILSGSSRHWRTINTTLCTFLTSKDHLQKYWENFYNTCISRNDPFEKYINEIYKQEICISPLKSLAVHMTNVNSSYGLSPYINYLKLWKENENV